MVKIIKFSSEILEYDTFGEISAGDQLLITAAGEASKAAYAPYSNFQVGAAVLLENGIIIKGNNQENVAYPSGLCAERVALFTAGAQYPSIPVKAIAITARTSSFDISNPLAPCGACRQVMIEYEKKHDSAIRLILMGESGKIRIIKSVDDILPFSFSSESLKKRL